MTIEPIRIRQTLLDGVRTAAGSDGAAPADRVIQRALDDLGVQGDPACERAVLTAWHDLVRAGYVAWGKDYCYTFSTRTVGPAGTATSYNPSFSMEEVRFTTAFLGT